MFVFSVQQKAHHTDTPGEHTSRGMETSLRAVLFPPATYPLSSRSPASFQWQSSRAPHPSLLTLPSFQWFYAPQGQNLCIYPITHPVSFAPTGHMSNFRRVLLLLSQKDSNLNLTLFMVKWQRVSTRTVTYGLWLQHHGGSFVSISPINMFIFI